MESKTYIHRVYWCSIIITHDACGLCDKEFGRRIYDIFIQAKSYGGSKSIEKFTNQYALHAIKSPLHGDAITALHSAHGPFQTFYSFMLYVANTLQAFAYGQSKRERDDAKVFRHSIYVHVTFMVFVCARVCSLCTPIQLHTRKHHVPQHWNPAAAICRTIQSEPTRSQQKHNTHTLLYRTSVVSACIINYIW